MLCVSCSCLPRAQVDGDSGVSQGQLAAAAVPRTSELSVETCLQDRDAANAQAAGAMPCARATEVCVRTCLRAVTLLQLACTLSLPFARTRVCSDLVYLFKISFAQMLCTQCSEFPALVFPALRLMDKMEFRKIRRLLLLRRARLSSPCRFVCSVP